MLSPLLSVMIWVYVSSSIQRLVLNPLQKYPGFGIIYYKLIQLHWLFILVRI